MTLTIKELKDFIKDLPDNCLVYHQRIEDWYFKKHIIEDVSGKHETTPWKVKEMSSANWPESGKKDEYIKVFTWIDYRDGNLYLTAHY